VFPAPEGNGFMKKQSYIYLIAAKMDMESIKKGHLGAQFYDLLT